MVERGRVAAPCSALAEIEWWIQRMANDRSVAVVFALASEAFAVAAERANKPRDA